MTTDLLREKEEKLRRAVRAAGSVVVAFSGGVDSTLLARIARDESKRCLAVTLDSVFFTRSERGTAVRLAERIGISHRFEEFDPLAIPEVAANPPRRCYYCKKAVYSRLLEIATTEGYDAVLDGSNLSDLRDYRPGYEAVKELGIFSPLVDAGLDKDDVRTLSMLLELDGFERPAAACLASRIPYGVRLEPDDLRLVERGEEFLRDLGFVTVRLRLFGRMACVELDADDLNEPKFIARRRREIVETLKEMGFERVLLDMEGYRTGSLNKKTENSE